MHFICVSNAIFKNLVCLNPSRESLDYARVNVRLLLMYHGIISGFAVTYSCGYSNISSVAASPMDPSRLKYPSMSTFVSWILYSMRAYLSYLCA